MAGTLNIEITADTVAWYGAIVGTISFITTFILGLLSYLRDRGKIKVKLSEGFLIPSIYLGDKTQIFVEAINTGRRPVTLVGVGFTLSNGKSLVIPKPINISFPYELCEGKATQVFTDRDTLLKQAKEENSEIKFAWYRDATGKVYKTKFKLNKK
jgi:hypothetical protein